MNTVKFRSHNTKVIAHRGLSGIERENTNASFIAAGNRSYFGIETDIHPTADGKFVIIHDESTERITEKKYKINVEENDFSKISDILLPDKDGSFVRRDIRIPLLSEYVNICKKYEKKCVLEIKFSASEEELKKIIEEIKSLDYLKNVIFISFYMDNCISLRKLLPDSEIQWLTDRPVSDTIINTLSENKLGLDIHHKLLTRRLIIKLRFRKIKINCWTCDSKAEAEKLARLGVDYITTNILEGD